MKVYTVKAEERPWAKAFFEIANIVTESLENIEGDDMVKVTPDNMPSVQDKPEPTTADTLSSMINMLEQHSRMEIKDIVRSLKAYYRAE